MYSNFIITFVIYGIIALTLGQTPVSEWGGLYPRESASRELKSLDGLWDFRLAPLGDPNLGFNEEWFKQRLKLTGSVIKMAVPSSYNDVTQDKSIRDHIGWAWYDRTFYIPQRWIDDRLRINLRLGSAHYNSIIYMNGRELVSHIGGHLPIMADISNFVNGSQENLITVAVNNTLNPTTIPQGQIVYQNDVAMYPVGYFEQKYNFDFFNYAGIHRPVFIYTTPATYIDDITVKTDIQGLDGVITYNISYQSSTEKNNIKAVGCSIKIRDRNGGHVVSAIGCIGQILIANATFWWPHLMNPVIGYQYTMMIELDDGGGTIDYYPQKVGIRTISWNETTVLFNGEKLYLQGVGKHEDADIRGKGVDNALIVKDFSLLKWLGANSFRTSHYPYAEEIMDMADEEGIMVIDESPAVGLNGFGQELLDNHMSVMTELIRRDKNRPSVIMWSVGNEPDSNQDAAEQYFQQVTDLVRVLDPDRPVTCVLNVALTVDKAAASLDVILLNRYFSWYSDTGHLEIIELQTLTEFRSWHLSHNKPMMIAEYGAGSIEGLHRSPSFTWSEEYQVGLMELNFKAFDTLRDEGFFFGEHIWNFADFATPQETTRPVLCSKGVFSRDRQTKMAAFAMRIRYYDNALKLWNCKIESVKSRWNVKYK